MKNLNSILLVDDDTVTNFINTRIIKKLKLANEVYIANNGQDALDLLQEFCEKNHPFPELILLDINMPVMNGFEFISEFKKFQFDKGISSEIIVLTTSTNPGDLASIHHLNLQMINKPLTESKLLQFANTIKPLGN